MKEQEQPAWQGQVQLESSEKAQALGRNNVDRSWAGRQGYLIQRGGIN